MADPITWGLLNFIKKRVKGVQTTLDGVSDKVSGLPDSLDADFMEVKNAIEGVKTDVGNVNTSVDDIKSDTESIKVSIDGSTLFNADSVVKSVQSGIKSMASFGSGKAQYITISSVNVEKSIVIPKFFFASGGSNPYNFSVSLESDRIKLYLGGSSATIDVSFSWQVIEFY